MKKFLLVILLIPTIIVICIKAIIISGISAYYVVYCDMAFDKAFKMSKEKKSMTKRSKKHMKSLCKTKGIHK